MRELICRHLRRASTQTTTPQHCSRSQILSLSKMQAWEYHPLVLCFLMRIHGALGNNVALFDWTVHIKWSQNPRGPFLGSVAREIGLFILAKLLSIMYRRSTCPEDKLHTGSLLSMMISLYADHGPSHWTVSMLWISSYFACFPTMFNSWKHKCFHWKNILSFLCDSESNVKTH